MPQLAPCHPNPSSTQIGTSFWFRVLYPPLVSAVLMSFDFRRPPPSPPIPELVAAISCPVLVWMWCPSSRRVTPARPALRSEPHPAPSPPLSGSGLTVVSQLAPCHPSPSSTQLVRVFETARHLFLSKFGQDTGVLFLYPERLSFVLTATPLLDTRQPHISMGKLTVPDSKRLFVPFKKYSQESSQTFTSHPVVYSPSIRTVGRSS